MALVAAMLAEPALTVAAARHGARLWWDNVLPALLPFFVGGQLLLSLGAGHFFGVLLEPLMRPLFALPGAAALVLAMAAGSGYPFGAVLTARLHRQGLLTGEEAERLMAFASTANPLFVGGTVASALLGSPRLAGLLLAAHYLAALATGLLLRCLPGRAAAAPPRGGETGGRRRGRRTPGRDAPAGRSPAGEGGLLRQALQALLAQREREGRGAAELLGEAVEGAVRTLLLIGGFIILFSVILRMLAATGLLGAAAALAGPILERAGLPPATHEGLLAGFLEITNGSQALAAADAPPLPRLAAISAVLAWGGLSVLAQVAAVTAGTGLRLAPFVLARSLHALLAAGLTALLYDPARHALPAWLSPGEMALSAGAAEAGGAGGAWLAALAASARALSLSLAGLAGLAALGCLVSCHSSPRSGNPSSPTRGRMR